MKLPWIGWVKVGVVTAMCLVGGAALVSAQAPARETRTLVPATSDGRSADELRDDLRELFRKYPPSLGQVLRLDPSLLLNDSYLAPFPELRAFVAQHPEVPRSPDYFLSFANLPFDRTPRTPSEQSWDRLRNLIEMLGIFSLFTGAALVLTWLIRHLLAHRRWLRATKIQMDIHNRLMERLSSSEDVRHYLQSAAPTRLLADVPPMLEAGRAGSPTGRILLAVQAGVVLVCAGSGLLLTKSLLRATGEAADVMVFLGVLALAIGIGFALASFASYVISRRLGLLPASASSSTEPA